jgi:hypothetical protein
MPFDIVRRGLRPSSLAALVIGLAFASAADAQSTAMPRVRAQPCEGYCRATWGTCARVALRSTPSEAGKIVGRVDSGQTVRVLDGRRITTRAGVVVVRRTHTMVQRLDGSEEPVVMPHPKRWRLTRGDTIHVVDKETDGDSFVNYVWILRGREDTTAAFWPDPADEPSPASKAQMVAPMEQAWWARVRHASGLTGWTTYSTDWTGTSYYDDPLSKCVAVPRRPGTGD